jgi:hypothetical protein
MRKWTRGIKLALIRELNAHYGVRLDPAHSLLGGVQTLEIYICSGTGIVIDESHMRRMIQYMPQCTTDLSGFGSKANPRCCENLAQPGGALAH